MIEYKFTFELDGHLSAYDFVTLQERLEKELNSYFDDKSISGILSYANDD